MDELARGAAGATLLVSALAVTHVAGVFNEAFPKAGEETDAELDGKERPHIGKETYVIAAIIGGFAGYNT